MYHVPNRKWILLFLCLCLSIAIPVFTGCSRGGGSHVAQTPVNAQTGSFIDSPVEGMQYSTPTWSGYTEPNGGFYYQKGEKIKFFIGGIYFGKVTATGVMTPLTLEGLDELTSEDTTVINMSRILLTLDQDRNPGNGITISRQLSEELAGVRLDLTNPRLVLDNSPEVNEMLAIVKNSIQGTGAITPEDEKDLLVSSADAQAHLENTVNRITAEAEETQETLENMSPVATISSPGGNVIMVRGQTLSFQGSVYGGKGPYAFSWSLPDGTSSSLQSPGNKTFNTLSDGFYVTLTVTDSSTGRTGSSQRFISVLDPSTQTGSFDADSIPTVTMLHPSSSVYPAGTTVDFTAKIYNGDVPLIYNWTLGSVPGNSFVTGSEKIECINPRTYIITQGIKLNSPGTYSIYLSVKDTNTGGRYPDTHAGSIRVTVN